MQVLNIIPRKSRVFFLLLTSTILSGTLLAGQSDKEIAIKYGIALVTVKHHLKSLRSKLGAKNRTHAVCRAIELGLTQQASEG